MMIVNILFMFIPIVLNIICKIIIIYSLKLSNAQWDSHFELLRA